jgi:hypothetical protein
MNREEAVALSARWPIPAPYCPGPERPTRKFKRPFLGSSWIGVGVDPVSTGAVISKKTGFERGWRNRASFADTSEVRLAGGTSKAQSFRPLRGRVTFFFGQKESNQSEGLPRQRKPKVCSATGIFRLANPWLGRNTTRIPARRPPGLPSASARIPG